MTNPQIIKPQEGFQQIFLSSSADIALGGGAASGGKSYALLLEALRGIHDPNFTAAIFRRTSNQLRTPGGLFDVASELYTKLGAIPRESQCDFTFPSGAKVKLASIEDEAALQSWQGAQLAYIGIDEVCHWPAKMVWYLMSRNRSLCSIRPYMRLCGNPSPDSFLCDFIKWWLDDTEMGFPLKERSGKIRWFIRQNDEVIWANTKKELEDKYGVDSCPKSFTFVSATIYDNPILLNKNPDYLASLKALNYVDRMQLLEGAWRVRASGGNFFKRDYFNVIDAIPPGYTQAIRAWDRSATKPSPTNSDPDWTVGLKLLKNPTTKTYIVADIRRIREAPLAVEQLIKNTASQDGFKCRIVGFQDPGSSGKNEAEQFVRMLGGFIVNTIKINVNKIVAAKAVSAQCEVGAIRVLRGSWNNDFFNELEAFPEGKHDDICDSLSLAYNSLISDISIFDCL